MNWKSVGTLVLSMILLLITISLAWNNVASVAEIPQPCEKPIAYMVGTFDRRFGLSYKTFLDALVEAEEIWEQPLGQDLFVYSPENGDLRVNLVYDYRQETTKTLSGLEGFLDENETVYQSLKAQYARLKTEYNELKKFYDAEVLILNEKNDAYETQIESWNKGQKNSRAQFEKLTQEKNALEEEVRALKVLESKLNAMVKEINALVARLNSLARTLNLNVENYNTIEASRGETFTGGLYQSIVGEESIDVYEFSSRDKLVRVLAHELGHALGLDHISDRKAMMYHLNEGETRALSDIDLTALQTFCGKK